MDGEAPLGEPEIPIKKDDKYRILWNINFLFYFPISEIKKLAIRLFLTAGIGYQYDRVELTVVSLPTMEQNKYGYGEFNFQLINFGAGLKVNIKDDCTLRLLYKVNNFWGEELLTSRLALGLSYRF